MTNYSLQRDGFEIIDGVLDQSTINELRVAVGELPRFHRGGKRNLLSDSEACAVLASSVAIKQIANRLMLAEPIPVRALFFDKTPAANWRVPWHQDTAIAVAERIETPDFTGWSVKDGVPHVHPPTEILESMVALRIHLDDCGNDNGPLRVIPGSHREGRLTAEQIEAWKQRVPEVACCSRSGGVLAMRPLLLHASSPARLVSHRRIIHIEYADGRLPNGLRWFTEFRATGPIRARATQGT